MGVLWQNNLSLAGVDDDIEGYIVLLIAIERQVDADHAFKLWNGGITRRKWTDEEKRLLVTARNHGLKNRVIAEYMGVSENVLSRYYHQFRNDPRYQGEDDDSIRITNEIAEHYKSRRRSRAKGK